MRLVWARLSQSRFEDKAAREPLEASFDAEKDSGLQRTRLEIQAAAVRRVERFDALAFAVEFARGEAGIGASLGAMAMQHVEVQSSRASGNRAVGGEIAETRPAAHGCAQDTEFECRLVCRKLVVRQPVFSVAVGEDANVMTAACLFGGEVEDVTEEAADRSAKAVQDAHGLLRLRDASRLRSQKNLSNT